MCRCHEPWSGEAASQIGQFSESAGAGGASAEAGGVQEGGGYAGGGVGE